MLRHLRHYLRAGYLITKSLYEEHLFFCMRAYYFRQGNAPKAAWAYSLWLRHVLRQKGLKDRLDSTSHHQLLYVSRLEHNAQISIVMGSRARGNSNFQLPTFLTSVDTTVADPDHVEVLIAADLDDDIEKLIGIIKKFPRLSIKLIGTPRGRGYFDLHVKYHLMLDYMSPASQVMQIGSDDCYFNRWGWDEAVLKAMTEVPDQICFLNLFLDRDLNSLSPLVASWWIFQRGPSSIYPTVSTKILHSLRETAKNHENYTAYGQSLMVDSFFEMLHIALYEASGQDRMVKLPGTIRRSVENMQQGKLVERKLRHRVVDGLMLYEMKLRVEHQRFMKDAAAKLAQELTARHTNYSREFVA